MGDPLEPNPVRSIMVLVVEDEFFIADDLHRVLVKSGFEVLGPASTVDDALDLLETTLPHVAILDVNLGREKVTPVALKLSEANVPFILASASPAHELASFPLLANAINLGKPTDEKRMVDLIRDLVAPIQ